MYDTSQYFVNAKFGTLWVRSSEILKNLRWLGHWNRWWSQMCSVKIWTLQEDCSQEKLVLKERCYEQKAQYGHGNRNSSQAVRDVGVEWHWGVKEKATSDLRNRPRGENLKRWTRLYFGNILLPNQTWHRWVGCQLINYDISSLGSCNGTLIPVGISEDPFELKPIPETRIQGKMRCNKWSHKEVTCLLKTWGPRCHEDVTM